MLFRSERLVGSPPGAIRKTVAPGGHLGLFMGRTILSDIWPRIARWLTPEDVARNAA